MPEQKLPRPCLHLVLKCILGNQVTSGQPRHIALYTSIYHASSKCPLVFRFCYCLLSFALEDQKSSRTINKLATNLNFFCLSSTYINAHLYFFLFLCCYALVGDASGPISTCTSKHIWSNALQTTSANGLSARDLNASWELFTLLFTLVPRKNFKAPRHLNNWYLITNKIDRFVKH